MENRNGLIAAVMVTHADGYAERDAAMVMLAEKQAGGSRRITVGADKAYDTKDFVSTVRERNVTPHVTRNNKGRSGNLDRGTARQPGYAVSLSRRWLVEKGLGWLKQIGPLRQVKLRGLEKVDWLFVSQLRGAQPDPAAETDRSIVENAPGAVCLNNVASLGDDPPRLANPYCKRRTPGFAGVAVEV